MGRTGFEVRTSGFELNLFLTLLQKIHNLKMIETKLVMIRSMDETRNEDTRNRNFYPRNHFLQDNIFF